MPCEIVLSIPRTQFSLATPLPAPEGDSAGSEALRQALHATGSADEVADDLRRAEFGIAPVTTVDRDGQARTVYVNCAFVVTITDLPPDASPAAETPAELRVQTGRR